MTRLSPARTRSPLGSALANRAVAGRFASVGLLLACAASTLAACSDDEDPAPAEQTGAVNSADMPDASVRELPGDGLEPTPEFDVELRQREPIGPRRLVERVDSLQGIPGPGGAVVERSDAGASVPVADAGGGT